MSHNISNLSSLLPSEFFSGDIDEILFQSNHPFPYEFTSPSSTESESDDDDVIGLTRDFNRSLSLQERLKPPFHSHLQKKRVFSGSCPTTPFGQTEEDSLERIYAAAGHVARMKMKMMLMNNVNDDVFATRGLLGAPFRVGPGPSLSYHQHHPNCAFSKNENEGFIHQQHLRRTVSGNPNYPDRPVGFYQDAWPQLPVKNQRRQQHARSFLVKDAVNGSCRRANVALKKECAGTGVFLPRNYSNTLPEVKKPAGKAQPFSKTMGPSNPEQPNIHVGFTPHYQFLKRYELAEIAMARQNAVMLAQQRPQHRSLPEKVMGPPEVILPQEWTY